MDNLCNNCIHKDVCSRWTATWGMKSCENFMADYQAKAMEMMPELVQAIMAMLPDLAKAVAEKIGADMRGAEDE